MLQNVTYSSTASLSCSCTLPADVILCVTASLVAPPASPVDDNTWIGSTDFDFVAIPATLIALDTVDCLNTYTFEYEDTLLNEPETPLVPGDIQGVQCIGCREAWLEGLVAAKEICFTDSDTITFIETEEGCVSAEAVGGEASNDWHILGNDDIVDGTNFLGTTTNVAVDIRVNNERAGRFQPASTDFPSEAAPDVILGYSGNVIDTPGGGNAILGGGRLGSVNSINAVPFAIPSCNVIGGGHGNFFNYDSESSVIAGGSDNSISLGINCVIGGGDTCNITDGRYGVVCGGQTNTLANLSWYSFVGGGNSNEINNSWQSFIGGGSFNEVTDGGSSTVVGGSGNSIDAAGTLGAFNFIGAGLANSISGYCSDTTIAGGRNNIILDSSASIIAGGFLNTIEDDPLYPVIPPALPNRGNVISGGFDNLIHYGSIVTIAGGAQNTIQESTLSPSASGEIGGGSFNTINGAGGTIAGGGLNEITDGPGGFIGGGAGNFITGTGISVPGNEFGGPANVICGGESNLINDSYRSVICGGYFNRIAAGSSGSAILGGFQLLLGTNSAGYQAYDPSPFTIAPTDLALFSNVFYIGDADLWLGNVTNAATALKLFEPNTDMTYATTFYSSLEAQTQAANIEYVMPAAPGVAGDSLKIQSVVGDVVTLEWAA